MAGWGFVKGDSRPIRKVEAGEELYKIAKATLPLESTCRGM